LRGSSDQVQRIDNSLDEAHVHFVHKVSAGAT
jgi:hypothetical protein